MSLLSPVFSFLSALLVKLVYCSYTFPLNSNFLHINDISIHCNRESPESYPYDVALKKCLTDKDCIYVKVEQFDVYNETYGKSKLCYSLNFSGVYPINNGRVSIKSDKRLFSLSHFPVPGSYNNLYNMFTNRKGLCRPGQVIGQLEPVSSYIEAARECQRLNCDYFTVSFYTDKNSGSPIGRNDIIRTNCAQFCVGEPLSLYSEGYLMSERIQSK